MVLVQLLLPAASPTETRVRLNDTQQELMDLFGGVTAYVQTPAKGQWADDRGETATDRVFLVEVVAPEFDRRWWTDYARKLAQRFEQDVIHVRALNVDVLDPHAT